MKRQGGFTLIELILVIVILGILAAYAVPKFANIEKQARIALVNGLKSATRSASEIVHATVLSGMVDNNVVTLDDGTTVNVVGNYAAATGEGIVKALDFDAASYNISANGDAVSLQLKKATTPANCAVTYTLETGKAPTITVDTSGC